ncbi:hypothetical protein C8R46DRAFT_445124 [Mycena filopes]|nr:hypothetical protein C8R46DRAFT_445124 [Mycena filopes]
MTNLVWARASRLYLPPPPRACRNVLSIHQLLSMRPRTAPPPPAFVDWAPRRSPPPAACVPPRLPSWAAHRAARPPPPTFPPNTVPEPAPPPKCVISSSSSSGSSMSRSEPSLAVEARNGRAVATLRYPEERPGRRCRARETRRTRVGVGDPAPARGTPASSPPSSGRTSSHTRKEGQGREERQMLGGSERPSQSEGDHPLYKAVMVVRACRASGSSF